MQGNPIGWVEIYVNDMKRAKAFYEAVFQATLDKLDSPDMEMFAFPMKDDVYGSGAALAKMPGCAPGVGGTLAYLSCDDCAVEAGRVPGLGGKVIREKFSIGEYGFIALIEDSEGNIVGLHSMR